MGKFGVDAIQILSINLYYDPATITKTKETTTLLKYESQHFRCKVQIGISRSFAEQNWSVGLIQACDRMYLENRYGNVGSSFWEFHPLKSGRHRMVNDSDGRQYPFYSLTSSKCEIRRGLIEDSIVNLHYEDHFYPTVAWELPYCGGAKLTDVIRKQDFWVWLVAIKRSPYLDFFTDKYNIEDDKLYVLKTFRWRYNLHMTFDPYLPPGRRLKHIYDNQAEKPYLCENNKLLTMSAANPPHCNAAQSLIWYPNNHRDRVRLLVPPKQTIVPWEQWLNDMAPGENLVAPRPRQTIVVREWRKDEYLDTYQKRFKILAKNRRTRKSSFERFLQSHSNSKVYEFGGLQK